MINLSQAKLKHLAVHKVGNKVRDEGMIASEKPIELTEELQVILEDFFLKPFKSDFFHQFWHETDLGLNEVYTFVKQIFTNPHEELHPQSVNILKHLYSHSTHPNTEGGELYVAHFRECELGDMTVDAVGIFKSENKEVYLNLDTESETVALRPEQGINIKRLDKGCLVFNTFEDDGFSLLVVERNQGETQYWREDFLKVQRLQDDSYQTQSYLDLCYDFCEEVLTRETDRKDQVAFLNKSIDYFSHNKEFEPAEFKQKVMLENPQYADKFEDFATQFETDTGLEPEQSFQVSKQAVREAKRKFKNLIKLNTGVEIKIPIKADVGFVERGYDEQRGMGYYKLYFTEED
ncbi:MAG: nucleoid-associated protein [Bacteroidota bacterium]